MAGTSARRTIAMDTVANPADYRQFEAGPFASFYPVPGHEVASEKASLGHHAHYDCWRKSEIPARSHYGTNPRIPPYFCSAETGWSLNKTAPAADAHDGGTHGYDSAAPEMAASFIAQACDIPSSSGDQISSSSVAMSSSKGAAGVTGAGFITSAATSSIVPSVPVAGMASISGVDRFMSECRSSTNFIGNAVTTVVVSRWEGKSDKAASRAASGAT
ncbi:hypothetical protein OY671_008580 [Metschnikowia pulcherrima]|nr:hypothetical protein OY671_008580 [Metschnikowia pulcherrima]